MWELCNTRTSRVRSSRTLGFWGISMYTVPITKHSCALTTSRTRGMSGGDPCIEIIAVRDRARLNMKRAHLSFLSIVTELLSWQHPSANVDERSISLRTGAYRTYESCRGWTTMRCWVRMYQPCLNASKSLLTLVFRIHKIWIRFK